MARKLDEEQSPFQKIEIYETTDWGNLMLIDGAMMLTTRDNFFYHEMMSHAALFTHADPEARGDHRRRRLRHPARSAAAPGVARPCSATSTSA